MNINPLDPTTQASLLTSLVLPFLLGLIQSREASNRFKIAFSWGATILVAALQMYLTKRFLGGEPADADGWIRLIIGNIIWVLIVSQTLYAGAKKVGAVDWLEARGPQLGYRTRHARDIIDTSKPTLTSARARHFD